ncbi:MAG: sugar kinase [Deltaproteobacteria bacterium]|nr:MAG: sugar kinase [Deltaproteobacteria bacterium]TDJ05543.1 MAG: sugar kinase [Deltaproteobacteria bacterium]
MSVLVVGSIAFDDIETPSGRAKGVLGGAACYFSLAASYFAPVRAVGVVGSDFPDAHLEFLRAHGVDTQGIYRSEGSTFRWGGRYRESLNERDTLFTDLGVFDGFNPDLPEAYHDSEYVFLANIHPSLQLRVLEQAHAPRFTAMDTMDFWIEGAREELERTLARVDGLVINDQEARQLTGERNLVRAVGAIRSLGPRIVIIKRGEHGALLFDQEGIFSAPAFPLREIQDPTGAGDSFAGGFVGALAREGKLDSGALRRAVIYGSVLASFCVECFGLDRFRELESQQIEERFAHFRALTTF